MGDAIYTEFIENQHVEDVWIPLDQLLKKSPFLCMAAFLVLNHLFFHTQLAAENLVKTELFVHPISERNFPEVSARKFLQTWSRWTLFFLSLNNGLSWGYFTLKSGELWAKHRQRWSARKFCPANGNHIFWASQAAQSLWTLAPEKNVPCKSEGVF